MLKSFNEIHDEFISNLDAAFKGPASLDGLRAALEAARERADDQRIACADEGGSRHADAYTASAMIGTFISLLNDYEENDTRHFKSSTSPVVLGCLWKPSYCIPTE